MTVILVERLESYCEKLNRSVWAYENACESKLIPSESLVAISLGKLIFDDFYKNKLIPDLEADEMLYDVILKEAQEELEELKAGLYTFDKGQDMPRLWRAYYLLTRLIEIQYTEFQRDIQEEESIALFEAMEKMRESNDLA